MKQKKIAEFRFYEKPANEPVLVLTGEDWIRQFEGDLSMLHFHNLMEIGHCIWGQGQLAFGRTVHDYHSGTFTFVPHNVLHSTRSDGMGRWEYLFFDAEEIIKDFYSSEPEKAEEIIKSISGNGKIYQAEASPHMCGLVQMIFELMQKKNKYFKEMVRELLLTILLQLASESETDNNGKKSEYSIAPALNYIAGCYSKEIRIRELAECCYLSEPQFRRVFQDSMNMTPVEYINLVRVQAACDLMKKNDYSMDEVAEKVGYRTISTFNRNFNKIVGIPPYQWKRQVDRMTEKVGSYRIRAKKGW